MKTSLTAFLLLAVEPYSLCTECQVLSYAAKPCTFLFLPVISLLSLILPCLRVGFFLPCCSTFSCRFFQMEHAATVLLQNPWAWSPSDRGSLCSRCCWRDFAISRQRESHQRAVLCILCTSSATHLLHQLLCKIAGKNEGRRMSLHMLLPFLVYFRLRGDLPKQLPSLRL